MVTLLRDHGPLAPSEIATRLGSGAATASRLSARLLELGLVAEGPQNGQSAEIGRPKVPLAFVADARMVAAVHIGATHLRVGLVDLGGSVHCEADVPHPDPAPSAVVAAARKLLSKAIRASPSRVVGISIVTGGWVDGGTVVEHPALGWNDVPLTEAIGRGFGLPVLLESHVRGLALAEARLGAARGVRNLAELHIGNVVDAAIMVNGTLLLGLRSSAGSVAHLVVRPVGGSPCTCGATGCLQAETADPALLDRARAAGLPGDLRSTDEFFRLAEQGDATADALLTARAEGIGRAAAVFFDLANPERVVIAGTLPGRDDRYPPVTRAAARAAAHSAPDVEARLGHTGLGPQALFTAAAAPLLKAYFDDPVAFEP